MGRKTLAQFINSEHENIVDVTRRVVAVGVTSETETTETVVKVPNSTLSMNHQWRLFPKTDEMYAQKQPSSKKYVIVYRPRKYAQKMDGVKCRTDTTGHNSMGL